MDRQLPDIDYTTMQKPEYHTMATMKCMYFDMFIPDLRKDFEADVPCACGLIHKLVYCANTSEIKIFKYRNIRFQNSENGENNILYWKKIDYFKQTKWVVM